MRHWFVGFGIVVVLLLLAMTVPVMAQEGPPDDAPVVDESGMEVNLLESLVFLAGLVAAIVELVKPAVKSLSVSDKGHDLILRLIGFGLGVAFVIGGGTALNLLALSPIYGNANPALGLVLTGLMVGGFSQGLYLVGSGLVGKPIKQTAKLPEVTRYSRE